MMLRILGLQLSWLERYVDIVEVTSSNLVKPTKIYQWLISKLITCRPFFCPFFTFYVWHSWLNWKKQQYLQAFCDKYATDLKLLKPRERGETYTVQDFVAQTSLLKDYSQYNAQMNKFAAKIYRTNNWPSYKPSFDQSGKSRDLV